MQRLIFAVVMALLGGTAWAQDSDSAIGNETTTVDQASDPAEPETAKEAKEPQPFKVPAGFRAKRRGKNVVYCRKDMESGTRFASERCYDETQLRELEAARQQEQADFDQARKICASQAVCGSG
jgi:hypothetical protein